LPSINRLAILKLVRMNLIFKSLIPEWKRKYT